MIDRALNDGLPVLPLPDFEIPDNLGEFDLPAGRSLAQAAGADRLASCPVLHWKFWGVIR